MKTNLLPLLLCLALSGLLPRETSAQQTLRKLITVRGTVTDGQNRPLNRAQIYMIEKESIGFYSDSQGHYELEVPELSTIVFEFQGLESQRFTVTAADTLLDVQLRYPSVFYLSPININALADTIIPIPETNKTPDNDLYSYTPRPQHGCEVDIFLRVTDEPRIRSIHTSPQNALVYSCQDTSLYKYVFYTLPSDSLTYPAEAIRQGAQDQVLVYFTLDKLGTSHDVHVLRQTHPALAQAAVDMVRKMAFRPARHRGKGVISRCVLPVNFSLRPRLQQTPVTESTADSTADSTAPLPQFTLRGTVTDSDGQPVPHVYVFNDTPTPTMTDSLGRFSMPAYAYQKIIFHRTGYINQAISLQPGDSAVAIRLYPEAAHIIGPTIKASSRAKKADDREYDLIDFFDNPQPRFPGNLNAYIEKHLRYPKAARRAGIEGEVVVTFVIDPDGNVTSPRVVQSVSESLDAEALRVVSLLPRWEPASHRGRNVPFRYTLSLSFRLYHP